MIRQKNFFYLLLLFLTLVSCKNNLIDSPSIASNPSKVPSEYPDMITPPLNVKASQGGYKSVTLSWDKMDNAVQYQIFSATTPFEDFKQCAETKGSVNSITISEYSGITKFYTVKAVNYYGTISSSSMIISGSSMATPIITSIDTNSNVSTVNWYMENCSPDTYQSSVKYTVKCYAETDKKNPVAEVAASADATSASFTTLESNKKYFFQVEAAIPANLSSASKIEKSALMDSVTAHLVIPSAPKEMTVEKGISTRDIKISWKLPDYVYVAENAIQGIFTQHPLYFKLERKIKDADDSTFQKLAVIKSVQKPNDQDSPIYFDCQTPQNSDSKLTVVPDNQITPNQNYPKYIPGSTITYTDSNVSQNIQYTYKITSYTDDAGDNIISSNSSVSSADGWIVPKATFRATGMLIENENDPNQFTHSNITFAIDFNEYGLSDLYSYIVTYVKTPIGGTAAPEAVEKVYTSVAELNSKRFRKDCTDENKGSYKYKLYVVPSSQIPADPAAVTVPSDYYAYCESLGTVLISDNKASLPKVEGFSVSDGYSNKFVISWKYDETYSYVLKWKNASDNSNDSIEIPQFVCEGKTTGETVTYEHPAVSGDARTYSLEANNGIPVEKTYQDAQGNDIISETLGTPDPVMSSPKLSTITISWPKVQKANANDGEDSTAYSVSAVYDDNTSVGLTDANTVITSDDENFYCTITEPDGFNDAARSGNPINFKVSAKNKDTSAQTESKIITVNTLGPSKLTLKTDSSIYENKIKMLWKKVPGAKGYLVCRKLYKDGQGSSFDSEDLYFVKLDNGEEAPALFTIQGGSLEPLDKKFATISYSGGSYTLTDIDYENGDGNNPYEYNQSKITWGLPFGYIVLPVEADEKDFTFEGGKLKSTGSKVSYLNLSEIKSATCGYGMQVDAAKAEDAKTQVVAWEAPYYANKLVPSLYRRAAGSEDTWENVNANFTAGVHSTAINPANADVYSAFEYAVKYNITSGSAKTNFTKSYIQQLASTPEDDVAYEYHGKVPEQKNKGYLLASKITAGYGGTPKAGGGHQKDSNYYSEIVTISPWDYENRALGPDQYKLYICNTDLGSQWTEINQIDVSKDFENRQSPSYSNTVPGSPLTDTSIDSNGLQVRLSPTGMNPTLANPTQTTDGVLKVLRNPKHYYKAELIRNDSKSKTTVGNDHSVFGYRQISNEELAQTAMLELCYGFFMNDVRDGKYENVSVQRKYGGSGKQEYNGGSISFTKSEGYGIGDVSNWGKERAYYSLSKYTPALATPGERNEIFLSLTNGNNFTGAFQIKGSADYFVTKFDNEDEIAVSNGNTSIPLSYSATIKLSAPNNKTVKITITRDGETTTLIDTEDKEIRKKWFPMQLHPDTSGYDIKNPEYGWWPKENNNGQ